MAPSAPFLDPLIAMIGIFIIPSFSLVMLFAGNELDLLESLFATLIAAPVISGSVTLLLSVASPPLNRTVLVSLFLTLTAICVIASILREKKVVLSYVRMDALLLAVLLLSSLLAFFWISSISHYVTPDENVYITSARLIVTQGKFVPSQFNFWEGSSAVLLSSRLLWSGILAALLATSNGSSAQLSSINWLFLLGIAVSSWVLLPRRFKQQKAFVVLPIVVLFSPILLTNSGSSLNDVAVAFYNVVALVFFLRSFETSASGVQLRLGNLGLTLVLLALSSLIKFNFIFLIPIFVVLLANVFKYRMYRSRKGKLVTIGFVLPVVIYELAIDVPRNLALYLFHSRALEFLTSYLPVSPVETLILAFVQTPYNLHPAALSYSALDYLIRAYTVISPENLSILVAATTLLLPFLLGRSLTRQMRNMAAVALLAMLLEFVYAVSTNDMYDIPRYYAAVVAPLTVVSLVIYADWCKERPRLLSSMMVAMLVLLGFNALLAPHFGGVVLPFLSGGIETIDVLLLEAVFYSLIVFLLMLPKSRTVNLRIGMSGSKTIAVEGVALIILVGFLLALLSNVYFSSVTFSTSPYFENYGTASFATEGGSFVFSNSYAGGTYVSGNLIQNTFYSSMPAEAELGNIVAGMPAGTKLLIFPNSFVSGLSEPYVGNYPLQIAGTPIIGAHGASPPAPSVNDSGSLFHADTMIGNSAVTIEGRSVNATYHDLPSANESIGTYMYFNGKTSFIDVPYSPVLNLSDSFTIEAWVKYQAVPNANITEQDAPIVDMSTEDGGFLLLVRDSHLWLVQGFQNDAYTSRLTVPNDTWAQIAVSYNGTSTAFNVNGDVEVVNGPKFQPLQQQVTLWIGRSHLDYGGVPHFKGNIAILDIYNRTIGQDQIDSDYASATNPPYFKLQTTAFSSNSSVLEYSLVSPIIAKNSSDVKFDGLTWSIANQASANPEMLLTVKLTSPSSRNATLVLSNDAFSTVRKFTIASGNTEETFEFPSFLITSQGQGDYGLLFARGSNILIVDDSGGIVLKTFTGLFQYSLPIMLTYSGLCLALILLVVVLWQRNRERPKEPAVESIRSVSH